MVFRRTLLLLLAVLAVATTGCAPTLVQAGAPDATPTPASLAATSTPRTTATPSPAATLLAVLPIETPRPETTTAATTLRPAPATSTPTPDLAAFCVLYDPDDPLQRRVDQANGLGTDYYPPHLEVVLLDERNSYFKPLMLRREVHQPLIDMLSAMNREGLWVITVSGFRSWTEQVLAYDKWATLYPDRVDNLSAAPGHSEHQLGTAIDFTAALGMDERFNVRFANTPEGRWLSEHAADFGFTLSYPAWAVEQTGYEYEPWHYRYVGRDLAHFLVEEQVTISAFLTRCSNRALDLPID